MKATREWKLCDVPGCERLARTAGSKLCGSHYKLERTYGSPLTRQHVRRDTPFWDRVTVIDDEDSCWEWAAGTQRSGRSQMVYEGLRQYVYRIAWQMEVGPIPEGMSVCHHCDNPPCCRPSHLFLGTHGDNMLDGRSKGRIHPPANGPRGAQHHDATLSDPQVAELRQRYSEGGVSQRQLAREYGITQGPLGALVRGESRPDAGGPFTRRQP